MTPNKSNWLISAVLVELAAAAMIVASMFGIVKMLKWAVSVGFENIIWSMFGLTLSWKLLVLGFFVTTIVATYRRTQIGRLLCLIAVAMFGAVLVYRDIQVGKPATNSAEATGKLVLLALFFYWFYAVGFSVKSKLFFQRKKEIGQASELN